MRSSRKQRSAGPSPYSPSPTQSSGACCRAKRREAPPRAAAQLLAAWTSFCRSAGPLTDSPALLLWVRRVTPAHAAVPGHCQACCAQVSAWPLLCALAELAAGAWCCQAWLYIDLEPCACTSLLKVAARLCNLARGCADWQRGESVAVRFELPLCILAES